MSDSNDQAEAIVEAALDLPPEQRKAYLDNACGADTQLRQLVEALLRAHEQFLAAPAGEPTVQVRGPVAQPAAGERPGDRIGPYKLLQQIGEGGCGVVYMAEQERPVRRRVALKVIKLGMDTKEVIARFEAERQALALMDHPNIAKVLDGGATEAGRPYFVMELVRGIRITDYCDKHNLATAERLDLFIQVCRAVQHAHQKGIIHRDIKPSNILVTLNDGVPMPKVIDFGIAKATQGRLTNQTFFTAFEQFIGTPAYMSPEQAEMSALDIDTRSDIYSLGVLLYELLTGKTPFEARRLLEAGLDEIRRIIREEDPPRPSTRLSTLEGGEQTTVAHCRNSEPPRLLHLVRGDLDWIVMKCLEKDRTRRYETANGLAVDIQRHLANEPVMARPPSKLYRFRKMARRNKLAFAASGAVAISLVAGLAVSTCFFFKEKRAREFADRQARRSEQAALMLKQTLKGAGPAVALGQDATLLKGMLDKTSERIAQDLLGQPDLEAEMCNTIGEVYRAIGQFEKAEAMHIRARALLEKAPVPDRAALATTLDDLALVLRDRGNISEADSAQRKALDLRRAIFGNVSTNVAISMNNLALVLRSQGKLPEAADLHREALAIQTKLVGKESVQAATCLNNLALDLHEQNRLPEAEGYFREALRLIQKFHGQEHPAVAIILDNLASVLRDEDKLDEAEALETKAVAMQKKFLGPKHKDVATALSNLGLILRKRGDLAKAEALQRDALAMRLDVLPKEHPEVANSLENLALTLRDQAARLASPSDAVRAKLKEAEDFELRALAMRQKTLPDPEHPRIARAYDNLGLIRRDQGRLPEAEDDFRKAFDIERKKVRDERPSLALSFEHLLDCLARERKPAEIELVANEILTPELQKTPQGARLMRARDSARAEAGKEKLSQ